VIIYGAACGICLLQAVIETNIRQMWLFTSELQSWINGFIQLMAFSLMAGLPANSEAGFPSSDRTTATNRISSFVFSIRHSMETIT
jgi:hypothetical protein